MAQLIDPVCDMTVASETAQYRSEYQGTIYFFCAAGCKRAFDKEPQRYTGELPGSNPDHQARHDQN